MLFRSMRVRDLEKVASRKVGEKVKLEDEVKELKNLVEELKVDIVKKGGLFRSSLEVK